MKKKYFKGIFLTFIFSATYFSVNHNVKAVTVTNQNVNTSTVTNQNVNLSQPSPAAPSIDYLKQAMEYINLKITNNNAKNYYLKLANQSFKNSSTINQFNSWKSNFDSQIKQNSNLAKIWNYLTYTSSNKTHARYGLTMSKVNQIMNKIRNNVQVKESLFATNIEINNIQNNLDKYRKESGILFLQSKHLTRNSYNHYYNLFINKNTYKQSNLMSKWYSYINWQTNKNAIKWDFWKYIKFKHSNRFGLTNSKANKVIFNFKNKYKNYDSFYAEKNYKNYINSIQNRLRKENGLDLIRSKVILGQWKNNQKSRFLNRRFYRNSRQFTNWIRSLNASYKASANFIKVDISSQILQVYKNGHLVKSYSVVTGDHSKHRDTPLGVWKIWNKTRNEVLKGSTVGVGADYNYEIPVKYWMPIDKTGVGIHSIDPDEVSRSHGRVYWGKNAYLTGRGSHGCINMHTRDAGWIYNHMPFNTLVYVVK